MMAYMAVASEPCAYSAQLQRSISIPASYSSAILQESPTAANSSLASFSDKFLLDSCQDSPYTPGSHATTSASSYQSDGSALSSWQALEMQLSVAQTAFQKGIVPTSAASVNELLPQSEISIINGSPPAGLQIGSSCSSSEILGSTMMSSDWQQLLDSSNRFRSSNLQSVQSSTQVLNPVDGIEGLAGGGNNRLGSNSVRTVDRRGAGHSIDSKLLSLTSRRWSSLEQACGISVEPTKGALALQGVGLATSHCLEQFSSDPAFAERAAKFSSFSNGYSQIPQPLPFLTSDSGKSRARVGSAPRSQPGDSESCKISRSASRPCPASGTKINPASISLSQKLETEKDPGILDTQPAETEKGAQDPGQVEMTATDHLETVKELIPQAVLEEETGIDGATDSDIDVKEGHGTQEDFSSTEQAACRESSDDTGNKRKEIHSEAKERHTAYLTDSKQQVDESCDEDSRAKRLKERHHHATSGASLDLMRDSQETKSTFKELQRLQAGGAPERSSSENSGDDSLSPTAGNNSKLLQLSSSSTMKKKASKQSPQRQQAAATAAASAEPPQATSKQQLQQDYVHVRARRGQATDSHSLAERVRREKISERMKYLQDLVPGCTKVTGKAVMLDEIINYVQSLQQQVEFLSMKLASVNPQVDYNLDTILNRESSNLQMLQSGASSLLGPEPSSNYWLHQPPLIQPPPVSSAPDHFPSLGTIAGHHLRRTISAPTRVPSVCSADASGDEDTTVTQISTGWDGELQSILQMGFAQTEPAISLVEGFNNCQLPVGHMKVEL